MNVIVKQRKKKTESKSLKSFTTIERLAKLLHLSEDDIYRMVGPEELSKHPAKSLKKNGHS